MRYRDGKISHFPVRRNLNTQKTDGFWFGASDNAIWNGNRVWMHSFERKLSPLSNGVSCKGVQRIGRELFDLKARGDIFFESPCIWREFWRPSAGQSSSGAEARWSLEALEARRWAPNATSEASSSVFTGPAGGRAPPPPPNRPGLRWLSFLLGVTAWRLEEVTAWRLEEMSSWPAGRRQSATSLSILKSSSPLLWLCKLFWRLSHLTWPGDLNWGDLESNFSLNVRKRCPYCFDAATATVAPLVANRRTISYGRPPAVAHGPSVTLF